MKGTIDLQVQNASHFVADEAVKFAIAQSIANFVNCSVSMVVVDLSLLDMDVNGNVTTTMPARHRRLQTQKVRVTYTIKIQLPEAKTDDVSSTPDQVNQAAYVFSSILKSISIQELGSSISANINIVYNDDAPSYLVAVVSVAAPVVTSYSQPTRGTELQNERGVSLVILATTLSLVTVVTVVVVFLFCKWTQRRKARRDQVESIKLAASRKHFDYYLSYSGQHSKLSLQPAQLALSIHDELSHRGLEGVFHSMKDTYSEDELKDFIENSAVLLVCLHDETCESDKCKWEWKVAEEAGLPVLCIADLQNCNKQVLKQQALACAEYLLQYPW